jgi:hypothetical protein
MVGGSLDQITRRNTRKGKDGDQKKQQRVLSTPQKFKCEYISARIYQRSQWKDIRCFVIDGKVVAAIQRGSHVNFEPIFILEEQHLYKSY